MAQLEPSLLAGGAIMVGAALLAGSDTTASKAVQTPEGAGGGGPPGGRGSLREMENFTDSEASSSERHAEAADRVWRVT